MRTRSFFAVAASALFVAFNASSVAQATLEAEDVVGVPNISSVALPSNPTFQLAKISEDELVLSVSGGYILETEHGISIIDAFGVTKETLSSSIRGKNNQSAELTFTRVSENQVKINVVDEYTPYGYWGCVGKNFAGGVVGGGVAGCAGGAWFAGVGCLAGAGAGAVTGGISAGVGSLIWCS